MLIGILQTGHAPDALRPVHGDYDQLFERLLADRGLPLAEQQQSVVFTAPVLGARDQTDAGEFRGWVSGAFRIGTVLDASTARDTAQSARVQLWDATDPAYPVLMAAVDPEGTDSDRPARTATVIAGNRRWTLSVVPTSQAVARQVGNAPLVALVAGGGLSLLLAALLFSVAAGRERCGGGRAARAAHPADRAHSGARGGGPGGGAPLRRRHRAGRHRPDHHPR